MKQNLPFSRPASDNKPRHLETAELPRGSPPPPPLLLPSPRKENRRMKPKKRPGKGWDSLAVRWWWTNWPTSTWVFDHTKLPPFLESAYWSILPSTNLLCPAGPLQIPRQSVFPCTCCWDLFLSGHTREKPHIKYMCYHWVLALPTRAPRVIRQPRSFCIDHCRFSQGWI